MKFQRRLWLAAFSLSFAFAFAPKAMAWVQEGGEGSSSEKKDEKKDDKKKEDEWFAVKNADVYTGTGAVIRGACVLSKNGKIEKISTEVDIPDGAKVLDAGGLRVYPGLVAFNSNGLFGAASTDFQDTVNPFAQNLVLALGNGITSTGQGGAALKLKRGEIEGVVMRDRYLVPLTYANSNPSGKKSLVDKLEATAKYLREMREWEEKKKSDKDAKEPAKKDADSSILQVLKGEVLARFQADSREDILAIARLAQKYGFRPVIEGCQEGWAVADDLGRAGAYAVITPRDRRDKSEELIAASGTSIENAAILWQHGVQVAIIPSARGVDLGGIAGRDILALQIEAGFAIRGGMPPKAAFDAITSVPARLLGVDYRIGTLEVGKDCDLIVTDGDVLHYQTFVQQAVVDGKLVYEKNKETYYAQIRPRSESALAPEKRVDKGQQSPDEKTSAEGAKDEKKSDEKKPSDEKKDDKKGG